MTHKYMWLHKATLCLHKTQAHSNGKNLIFPWRFASVNILCNSLYFPSNKYLSSAEGSLIN